MSARGDRSRFVDSQRCFNVSHYVFPLFRWDRTAKSPIRDWPISTREHVYARQYRLPGDRRRGGRDGRVHSRANGFPRENQGYVTQSRRRVRVFFFHFFLFPVFPRIYHGVRRFCKIQRLFQSRRKIVLSTLYIIGAIKITYFRIFERYVKRLIVIN